ncbi:cytochrome c oxidase accessory protein CcoG [Algicola sagamiensis]|uniref:cytochrome c oxidase accessory protein CcoG n=1 Tax=Algicola sagamiensis TaxID=163869 RepID=UPI00037B84BF|nr:cytochrome c oxidase accessory protein CcoG [Algicola sagamiensis]
MSDKIEVRNIPAKVEIHQPDTAKVGQYNPRSRIYVRAVQGVHQLLRRRMNMVFMAVFMILPWIQFNGRQAILLDLAERQFNIFGLTLWPQDLTLFTWLLIIAAFALFFVTTFYGRVWCGYMCPQTVWTLIFIWFEEKFEGTRNQRIKLDKMPMSWTKFRKKAAKHTAWWSFSFLTSLTFIAYFVPVEELFIGFFTGQSSALIYGWVIFFAVCTYGNAGWMREIMCTHICPYARFQSAMFDKETFTVSYDPKRGESRGPRPRKKDPKELGLGDCIDCNLCVQVCPTGIDIRNGLQYECINCGACIDACDGVMDKMGYEKGLISYTTEQQLEGKKTHIIRPKLLGYFIVLLVMLSAFAYTIVSRIPLDVDIIRDRNTLYRENFEGWIENTFTLKILNKSQQDHAYIISVEGLKGYKFQGRKSVIIKAGEVYTLPVTVSADPMLLKERITEIHFIVQDKNDPDVKVKEESNFFNRI